MPTDLLLRPGTREDLPAVADLYVRARDAAVPSMPPRVHDVEAVASWVVGWDLVSRELWVAEREDGVLGYAVLEDAWLSHLYVDPDHQGYGVGAALLELVQALRPHGFGLWVFLSNHPARRFYAAHGLIDGAATDGSQNEEGAPDLTMTWPGSGATGSRRWVMPGSSPGVA